MDLGFLASYPLWIIAIAVVLFFVGLKFAKMAFWGLAIVAAIVAGVWFGFF